MARLILLFEDWPDLADLVDKKIEASLVSVKGKPAVIVELPDKLFPKPVRNALPENLDLKGLNHRQIRFLHEASLAEPATNQKYRRMFGRISPETARLDLKLLVTRGLLEKAGSRKGTVYQPGRRWRGRPAAQ